MPDRDLIHSKLSCCFLKSYKMLCGGQEKVVVARIVLQAVRKKLQEKGDALIEYASVVASTVKTVFDKTEGMEDRNDMCSLASAKINRIINHSGLPSRDVAMIQDATRSCLHDIRYGQSYQHGSINQEILERYIQRLYISEFDGKVRNQSQHWNNVNNDTITYGLEAIKPLIDEVSIHWANKMIERGTVMRLRLPRSIQLQQVDLEENLL